MVENNEIQELIKKAVTSKSLEVLTEAEAKKLVDSQTCRPGMISYFLTFGSLKIQFIASKTVKCHSETSISLSE